MNVETSQAFKQLSEEEMEEQRIEEAEKRREYIKKYLKDNKCFKDFMMGREEQFEEIETKVMKTIFSEMNFGTPINGDHVIGAKIVLDMLKGTPKAWDARYAELGE